MARMLKEDVERMLRIVNEAIPQKSKTTKRETQANYAPQYGGWLLVYFDENCKAHTISQLRMSTSEAYKFLEGMLYSINAF